MAGFSDAWEYATKDEKWYAVTHPFNAAYILAARSKAYQRAEELFEAWTLEDGAGDAFRHAFAAAMLARDIGVTDAYRVTDMHEDIPGNPYNKKTMDLFNNRQGVLIYQEAQKHLNDCGLGIMVPSDEELEGRVLSAVRQGRLKVIRWKRK